VIKISPINLDLLVNLITKDHSIRANELTLAVVIPTFNEIGNVATLVGKLKVVLAGLSWEVIFVDDDSPDGTAQHIQQLALTYPNIRCIRRVGRRGLSSACVEGMLATHARFIAVMDADLQHDENKLPRMLDALVQEGHDLAVGSRYIEGGSVGDWQADRQQVSWFATLLSQRVLGLTVSDPMSGFFMMRREVMEEAVYNLSNMGFKILVDLIVSSPKPLKIIEIPFKFGQRTVGESKLDNRVAWDFLMLLVDKTVGRYVPVQLVSFGMVGGAGVCVHVLVLSIVMALFPGFFLQAQALAVGVSMVFNFGLNNELTYRDQRLQGWPWLSGLIKFMLACSIGAAANVGVASYIYTDWGNWLWSGMTGILVGMLWNYAATAIVVWPRRRRP
jgi:dolichol-phosphate mannosyltransferase